MKPVEMTACQFYRVCALIASVWTFAVFVTVYGNQFVDFDDLGYIVNNAALRKFDIESIIKMCTESMEANWHPLTLISFAVEYQLFGLTPDGVHLVNITIHSFTVYSVFFLFRDLMRQMSYSQINSRASAVTSDTWNSENMLLAGCCLASTLFFGIHPLRVESVVWASERKDVLCLFFTVCTIRAYLRFCRTSGLLQERIFWRCGWYWAALMLAFLALCSKPLAVSIPLILLILDRYVLGRMSNASEVTVRFIEKIPFCLISACCALMTIQAQKIAMARAPDVDVVSRLLVASKALFFYPVKTVWPSDLAAFYIHPGMVSSTAFVEYLVYPAAVAAIFALLLAGGRRCERGLALWLFHIITLLPMLGLIQVGGQWVADRYSYMPALGMSISAGYGLLWVLQRFQQAGRTYAVLCCGVLAFCTLGLYTLLTLRQIPVWRTTESLMTNIIDKADQQSWSSFYTRARYRNETGRFDLALDDIGQALDLATKGGFVRRYTEIGIARAHVLYALGRYPEAFAVADWALKNSVGEVPEHYRTFWKELKRLNE